MSARATNLTILALLLLELASGLGSFLVGSPEGRWVFWLHGAGGLSLVVLLVWKWRIVMRSFARRGAGVWSLAPALLGVLFLGTLATGLCVLGCEETSQGRGVFRSACRTRNWDPPSPAVGSAPRTTGRRQSVDPRMRGSPAGRGPYPLSETPRAHGRSV